MAVTMGSICFSVSPYSRVTAKTASEVASRYGMAPEARALLKDAPILILDEPTSALDAETEALLMGALDRLTQGRSTFIIAHRLSTVRRATRILVLQDGTIAESGTHEELLRHGRLYAKFHQSQLDSASC